MKSKVWMYAPLLALSLVQMMLTAQTAATPDTSPLPFHSYSGGKFDQIQLQNGSLSIRIPLFSISQPGRNAMSFSIIGHSGSAIPMSWPNDQYGGMDYWFASPDDLEGTLAVDSNVYGEQYITQGAHITHDQALSLTANETPQVGYGYISYLGTYPIYSLHQTYSLRDGLGASHRMGFDSTDYSMLRATDGSGWTLKLPTANTLPAVFNWTSTGNPLASDTTGHRFTFVSTGGSSTQDLFGNQITFNQGNIADNIGRSLTMPTATSGFSSVTCPSLGISDQPVTSSRDWAVPGLNGGTATYTLCFTTITLATNYWGWSGIDIQNFNNGVDPDGGNSFFSTTTWHEQHNGLGLLQSVILPDGSHWNFIYDTPAAGSTYTYGDIVEVRTPEGGSIKYQYNGLDTCGPRTIGPSGYVSPHVRAVTSRVASAGSGSGSPDIATNYSYSALQTTETTAGNDVVHTFTADFPGDQEACGANETETKFFQGTASANQQLKDVTTSYSSVVAPQDIVQYQTAQPKVDVLPQTVTTQVTGQASTTVTYNYETLYTDVEPIETLATHNLYSLQSQQPVIRFQTPISVDDGVRVQSTPSYASSYPDYKNANLLELRASAEILDELAQTQAKQTFHYDDNNGSPQGAYGNLTSTEYWTGPSTSPLSDSTVYNGQGAVTQTADRRGILTNVNNFQCGGIFAASTTTAYATPIAETMSEVRDCNTGLVTSRTDPNGVVTAFDRSDPLGRVTKVRAAVGTPSETHTRYSYPSRTQINVAQDKDGLDDGIITGSETYDGLGRIVRQTGPNGAQVDTSYDNSGNVASVSNPYTGSALYYSSFQYDALGRKTMHCNQDNGYGATCTPLNSYKQWVYAGDHVTESDEARSAWTRTYDSLGHLSNVVEPGGSSTGYTYDVVGNLLSVDQTPFGGSASHHRGFSYDHLSRLTQSSNPETGWICYGTWSGGSCINGYDANGNLLAKTDARGVTTTYTYDSLNRLTGKHYFNGLTPDMYYSYDVAPSWMPDLQNTIGRLANSSNAYGGGTSGKSTAATYSYDAMGRIVRTWQQTPSASPGGVFVYSQYDLAGDLKDLTYPDGRHIKQAWNAAGQLSNVNFADLGGVGVNQNYVQNISYLPDGSPNVMTLGNGVQQTITKNSRLQVQNMSVTGNGSTFASTAYCYAGCSTGGIANNGNIWGITDQLNPARTQGFTYDALNRISSFSLGGSLNQQYSIDSFGNMSLAPGGVPSKTFDAATNRISNLPCASATTPFDGAGNQLCDTDANGGTRQYVYDAESHVSQIASLGSSTPFVTYDYSPDGSRARKGNADGTYTEYIYSAGQPIAEIDQTGSWSDYIYANGKKIARASNVESRIHLSGTNCSSCGAVYTLFNMPLPNYTIQSGDVLYVTQYLAGSTRGGLQILMSTPNSYLLANDQNGNSILDDTVQNQWNHRRFTMPQSLVGQTLSSGGPVVNSHSPGGAWNFYLRDITIVQANGTVISLYKAGNSISLTAVPTGGVTQIATTVEAGSPLAGSDEGTVYILGDHLGTAQMELSSAGFPTWQGQFAPFGQELDNQTTVMHYKFTGKERDAESGLDYFGARYYGSNVGRWMSPDSVNVTDERMMNPSSTLNRYAYGANNPLKYVDPDGNDIVIYLENGLPGHIMMMAYDPHLNSAATRSFGPDPDFATGSAGSLSTMFGLPVPATTTFGFDKLTSADAIRKNFASMTIKTSPEVTQQVVQALVAHSGDNWYTTGGYACASSCARILHQLEQLKGICCDYALVPDAFFNNLYEGGYGNGKASQSSTGSAVFKPGTNYGAYRPSWNEFDVLFRMINPDQQKPRRDCTINVTPNGTSGDC